MRALPPLILACLVWTLILAPASAVSGGQSLRATPDQLRALYVQRLVRYVQWPDGQGPGPGEPFIVAATSPHRLEPYFRASDGTHRFRLVKWPCRDFHILILNDIPDRESAAILARVAERPVLTISQSPDGLRQGVVVNLYMNGGRLKMAVNPEAASRVGLTISSRLLKLARIYRGESND